MGECETIVFVVAVTGILTFFLSKPMEAYQLGETYAKKYGCQYQNVPHTARDLIEHLIRSGNSVCGTCVVCRDRSAADGKAVIPDGKTDHHDTGMFLGGAVFCMFCDLLARMVFAPTEMSISTVTAIFGAPVMIAVMLKQRQERY